MPPALPSPHMSSVKKNILVGVTVIGAFVVLGWMIIQFGGQIGGLAAGASYPVLMDVPRIDGLAEGNQVRYLGKTVGRIETMVLNEQRSGFHLKLGMQPDVNLPMNVHGVVRATNLISGGAAIDLELNQPTAAESTDSATAAATRSSADLPQATGSLKDLPEDAVLSGTFAGADLIPPEFSALATQGRELIADLRSSGLINNLNAQVTRIGQVADNVNATIGDEQLRGDIKAAVANAKEASASLAETAKRGQEFVDKMQGVPEDVKGITSDAREAVAQGKQLLTTAQQQTEATSANVNAALQQLSGNLQRVDKVLGDFQTITANINAGKGTAGALVNDDRLYRELVETTRLLETTVKTVNRLTEQWEQEGVKLRL